MNALVPAIMCVVMSSSYVGHFLLFHRVQYTWFHIIFAIGAMYVAMLLTDWCVSSFLIYIFNSHLE